ncbi:succinate dehydrogenase iron-sulfur subunit [Candidatus Photodesmus katoptron]|uniref:Succinate dehydrogenase iron-sulfur subunit n=1 Tax=Candidatus Photodesmus katoptron Akat1 TaxID=1236703 RepID=S3DKK9_9GAMM|nr:succinate dehydrogenase iron-sulfur subunit [Candidatus Photodesmus katoptron]EPE37664.1 succinate dehydrogenase iron-sulfur subunit [Candidatus Photodesmus katoptron Akat1]KEY90616.1 succinate dehydrogenase iron-sulfur subunit [Candidatus Photodesmus katoptron]
MDLNLSLYRYNPDYDNQPYMKDYTVTLEKDTNMMLLDLLSLLQEQDSTIVFRRSCREGVCGSDGLNVNGKNCLACITPLSSILKEQIIIRPLPGLPVIRDLVVDMTQFYNNYKKIKPFLIGETNTYSINEYLQTPKEREKLDGLYECIMCACCTASCPSFWWNPDKFIGPAGLLAAYRWLIDSRDTATNERLSYLDDAFSVFRCHTIMNCVSVCPKGLNPTRAIRNIKSMLFTHSI